jgi:hypothetical protein
MANMFETLRELQLAIKKKRLPNEQALDDLQREIKIVSKVFLGGNHSVPKPMCNPLATFAETCLTGFAQPFLMV